jgi:NAD(P)-dependent dehydrogenase (short-subunit alcohol dehydrogenase family)
VRVSDFIPDLKGKTILVTGATSGIGLEAAAALARAGANVTIVGRDPAKTAAAQARSGAAESLLCDFASQAQVRKLAAEFRARHERLHVLVNNAGSVSEKRTVTEDGIETTFAVNHLGSFLLTNLLLDLLVRSAPARIVNVASVGHYRGTLDFDDLGFERGGYQIMRAYSRSKLANVLFTRALSRRLAGKGVTVNAVHPGAVTTAIWDRAPRWAQPILAVGKLFMRSAAGGAEPLVHLAASPVVEGKNGLYFDRFDEKPPSRLASDDALAERLWTESARLVRLEGFSSRMAGR